MANKKLSAIQQQKINRQVERHISGKLHAHVLTRAEFLGSQFKQHISTSNHRRVLFPNRPGMEGSDSPRDRTRIIKEDLLQQVPYLADLISALVVTIVAVIGIILVTRWAKKPQIISAETETKS